MEKKYYIGTIKKFNNKEDYDIYKEFRFESLINPIDDFKNKELILENLKDKAGIVEEEALLRKCSEDQYEWIKFIEKNEQEWEDVNQKIPDQNSSFRDWIKESETSDIKLSLLDTRPIFYSDTFVDKKTLIEVPKVNHQLNELDKKKKEYQENKKNIRKLDLNIGQLNIFIKNNRNYNILGSYIAPIIYTILVMTYGKNLYISTPFAIPIMMITSLISGVGITKIIQKIRENKTTQKITNAKTQSEKMEQKIKWTIEKEKQESKNKIIELNIEKLKKAIMQKSVISEGKKFFNSNNILADKYQTLNRIINQKNLTKLKDRKKNLTKKDWKNSLIVGTVVLIYYIGACFNIGIISTLNVIKLIMSFTLGTLAGLTYFMKEYQDHNDAVNNIIKELEQNVIADKKIDESKQELEVEIKKLIEEISNLEFQIQEAKMDQLIEEVQQEKNKTTTPSIEELKQMKKSITEASPTEVEETFDINELEKDGRQFTKRK